MGTRVGKTKQWRKTPNQINPETGELERYGRKFRNAMARINATKSYPTAIILTLMKSAGIATPIFDKTVLAMQNNIEAQEQNVVDAEIVDEA